MSQPGGGDNLGRYRSPVMCGICASTEHYSPNCTTQDEELGKQIRADERKAVREIAALLSTKVQRPRWQRTLLDAFRAACRVEETADFSELVDIFKSMDTDKDVRRG